MKTLIFGSSGFIGNHVTEELLNSGHEVLKGVKEETGDRIDLLDTEALTDYFQKTSPEVVINCAGIVDASGDLENNVRFTENILAAAKNSGLLIRNVLVTGSAGEYGEVATLPVAEDTPLKGSSPYALSKIKEEHTALAFSETNNIPVTIVRVFNPIGIGMKARFLIPGFLRQIKKFRAGEQDSIEVSRLDSPRDYVDVRDVARAFRLILEGKPKHRVYNIGSGRSTTNGEVVELLIKSAKLSGRPRVIETAEGPEPQIASQANITRIKDEFNWGPQITLEQTIKDITDAVG